MLRFILDVVCVFCVTRLGKASGGFRIHPTRYTIYQAGKSGISLKKIRQMAFMFRQCFPDDVSAHHQGENDDRLFYPTFTYICQVLLTWHNII